MSRSVQYLSKRGLTLRWFALCLSASPLIGAFFYGYTVYSSPFVCPLKTITGIPCPSCGMTRSFLAIAQGHLLQAVHEHFFGIFLFCGLGIGIFHLGLEIIQKRKIMTPLSHFVVKKNNLILILIMFLSYYLVRLYNLNMAGQLLQDFYQSPLGKMFS